MPAACYAGSDGEKFYQYTMIEETSRKRFIHSYRENSDYSTGDFVKRVITWFSYAPSTIQTDHGGEFTNSKKHKKSIFPTDSVAASISNTRGFDQGLHGTTTRWSAVTAAVRKSSTITCGFTPTKNLQTQMKRYLYHSNNIPMSVLG